MRGRLRRSHFFPMFSTHDVSWYQKKTFFMNWKSPSSFLLSQENSDFEPDIQRAPSPFPTFLKASSPKRGVWFQTCHDHRLHSHFYSMKDNSFSPFPQKKRGSRRIFPLFYFVALPTVQYGIPPQQVLYSQPSSSNRHFSPLYSVLHPFSLPSKISSRAPLFNPTRTVEE